MTARLKRRGVLALIIYFLMITAVSVPLAFYTGRAESRDKSHFDTDATSLLSQNDLVTAADYAALHRAQRLGAGCGGIADPDISRRGIWEVICHPYTEGDGYGAGAVRTAGRNPAANHLVSNANPGISRRNNGQLQQAVVSNIAEKLLGAPSGSTASTQSGAGGGDAGPGAPLSLALAPAGGGGYLSANNGGPNAPGGLPGNIIPNTIQTTTEPPVLATPVPAALPMLIAGFAGLFAAAKRRKNQKTTV